MPKTSRQDTPDSDYENVTYQIFGNRKEQNKQWTYTEILKGIRVTTVVDEKQ